MICLAVALTVVWLTAIFLSLIPFMAGGTYKYWRIYPMCEWDKIEVGFLNNFLASHGFFWQHGYFSDCESDVIFYKNKIYAYTLLVSNASLN